MSFRNTLGGEKMTSEQIWAATGKYRISLHNGRKMEMKNKHRRIANSNRSVCVVGGGVGCNLAGKKKEGGRPFGLGGRGPAGVSGNR